MKRLFFIITCICLMNSICIAQNGLATFTPILREPIHSTSSFTDCNQLPSSFNNYKQAFNAIILSHFDYVDSFNAENSFITKAIFKSCDGINGFIIVYIKGYHPYIYQGVPTSVWNGFKDAQSSGNYYNYNIRGRYTMYTLN